MATQQTGPVFRSERQREVVEFTCADGANSNGSLWAEQFDAGARLAMRPRGREKRSSHNAQCASLAGRWAATARRDDPLLDKAVTHHAYGQLLRARGDRRNAVTQLRAAHKLLSSAAAEPFVARSASRHGGSWAMPSCELARHRGATPGPFLQCEVRFRASKMALKGVSATRRNLDNPARRTTSRSLASPACAPRTVSRSWAMALGVHSIVDKP